MAFLGAAVGGTFRVRHIYIVGAAQVPSDAIIQGAGVLGQNIFTVRSDRVVRQLGAVTQVDVTKVETSLPDRVTIYVHPRIPVLAWKDGRNLYEVDRFGRIVQPVAASRFPLIIGLVPGKHLDVSMVVAVRYALTVLPAVPRGTIATFRIEPRNGLMVIGRAGWAALIGTGTDQTLVARVATLATFLRSPAIRGRSIVLVDLRGRSPYARFGAP
jgi:POTRA domain, FtsQ-type